MNNIYLIGMPGCGKTTLGRILAEKINRRFIDVDEMIEKKANMSIAEIFEKYGENHFRIIETNCLIETSLNENYIISTGGGIVTRDKNIKIMKNTGRVIYIDTPLNVISSRKGLCDRPLLSDNAVENLKKLYNERQGKYIFASDIVFKTEDDVNENIKNLIRVV